MCDCDERNELSQLSHVKPKDFDIFRVLQSAFSLKVGNHFRVSK